MARNVARENAGGLSRQSLFTHGLPRNITATSNPGVNDDINGGYNVGSIWVNVSSDAIYFCADASDGAAVWALTASSTLTELTALSDTDSNFIVGNGSAWVAESGATARTSLGLGTAAVAATGISNTNVPIFTSGAADNDFLRIDGTSIEGLSASEVAAAIESSIDAVGTIASGTWEGTTIAVDQGGTGATSLSNLITLTTHTTGNYVATVTGGTGIDSTGATSGEGIAHSLSLDLSELTDTAIANGDYIVFTDTTDSNATVKGDLADVATLFAGTGLTASSSVIGVDASQTQITSVGALNAGSITSGFTSIDVGAGAITTTGTISAGNLTVTGTTTTINSTVTTVVDPIMHLQTASGGGALASDTNKDVGLALQYYTDAAKTAFLGYDDSAGRLTFVKEASLSSEVISGTLGDLDIGGIYATDVTLDGDKSVTPGDGAMIHVDTSTITDSNTSGSGTAAKYTHVAIEAPTLAATNASVTTSDVATLYINAAATAGTNQTITRNWAMWVDTGNARFDGSIYSGTTEAINSSGLVTVANQSNITGLGTITSGTWQSTDIGVEYGGTGVSTFTSNAVLTGNGTSAIQAESTLLFASNKLIPTASAHDAAGTVLTMSAGATTAGTTNNIAGGALTFQGGQGKGSGAGGAIIFQVANEGGSGSSLNALATALTINDDTTITTAGAIELGHASDTTIARSGSGDLTIEGNAIYRAGGTDVAIADGGTGAGTATAGFDALSPMTTEGDIIYGASSGTVTRLARGSDNQTLMMNGNVPNWETAGTGITAGFSIAMAIAL
jgi:hypothetical protein